MAVPVDSPIGPRARFPARLAKACRTALLLALPISLFPGRADTPANAPDKKQLDGQAKQMVVEAKSLEDQGKLAEAKDKYIDALALVPNPDALSGVRRIDDAEKRQTLSILSEAHRLYNAGKFRDSAQRLDDALKIEPDDTTVHYDLALCDLRLNDRNNATLHLDSAISSSTGKEEKLRLVEWRSQVLVGISQPAIKDDANGNLSAFNESFIDQDWNPDDPKAKSGSLCQQTNDLIGAYPADPAIVFNAAKCAEEDGRQGDAARELGEYAKLAPMALDQGDAAELAYRWQSLAEMPGDAGQSVRQHYANASRYLDYRRYDRAIGEYEEAVKAMPDYSESEWQLALLYESYGDVAKSEEHFSRFKQLETGAARRSGADAHTANLARRRAVYDANVEKARETLSELQMSALGLNSEGVRHKTKLTYRQWRWASSQYKNAARATEKLPAPYVERQLSEAREDLVAATALFPLGAEANELLALIDLEGNNWPEAYLSYDAVAAQGLPVSFYAQISSAGDSKVVRAAKVEIAKETIRLIYLSTYNPKKQISEPPGKSAGEDGLGDLVVAPGQPADLDPEATTIKFDDLKAISTDRNFVVLKRADDQIYLSPLNIMGEVPFEGGASRTFGNEYTRLFIRYLGFEQAKLGKEGMTTGEKFILGFQIARIAGSGLGMAMSPGVPTVYGRAKRLADLIHALRVFHSVAQGARAADIADAAMRLADDLQESVDTLERTAGDERRAVEGMEFKAIPIQSAPLRFSEKL